VEENTSRLGDYLLIIPSSSTSDVEAILPRARLILWISAGSVSLVAGFVLLFGHRSELISEGPAASHIKEELHLEELGKGALSLHPLKKSSLVPDLSREILVLARSSRPDCDPGEGAFLLSTKSNSQSRVVAPGEQIFLECQNNGSEDPIYRFTDKRTALWIRPMTGGQEDVCIEVGFFSPSKQSESFLEEVAQVLVQPVRSSSSKEKKETSIFSSIRQAKWWGSDSLLKQYGGAEYREMMGKQKIEIPAENGSEFYFLAAGDYLQWQEGSWQKTSLSTTVAGAPLAQVKNVTPKTLAIEVWDEKGFYPQLIHLELQAPNKTAQKNDLNSSSIRLRSSSQVACTLGKRRFILKEGDWLLKVGKSWRNLRRSKDVESCLQHRLRGELFIFDSIEKQQGKYFLKGHLFDEMRTQMTPISLPISSEDPAAAKGKKGKSSPLLKKKDKNEI